MVTNTPTFYLISWLWFFYRFFFRRSMMNEIDRRDLALKLMKMTWSCNKSIKHRKFLKIERNKTHFDRLFLFLFFSKLIFQNLFLSSQFCHIEIVRRTFRVRKFETAGKRSRRILIVRNSIRFAAELLENLKKIADWKEKFCFFASSNRIFFSRRTIFRRFVRTNQRWSINFRLNVVNKNRFFQTAKIIGEKTEPTDSFTIFRVVLQNKRGFFLQRIDSNEIFLLNKQRFS